MTRLLLRVSIPSPPVGVWHVGLFPVRAYAVAILTGVVVATAWAGRRWTARGGRPGGVADVVMWAVPAGLVGARLYHLGTDPELYFTAGRDPWAAFAVWQGGLGIWGGVAGGIGGAWYACRRYRLRLADVLWTVAPALPVAQAIGRLGNWFNQELDGSPSTLPWAVAIDPAHRPPASPLAATYQPTFLYELLWDLAVAAVVVGAQRRFRLSGWASFAVYAAVYAAGRGWIEALRVDHANHILGLRVNDWVSILVFTAAVAAVVVLRRQPPPGPFSITADPTITDPTITGPAADPAADPAVDSTAVPTVAAGSAGSSRGSRSRSAAQPPQPLSRSAGFRHTRVVPHASRTSNSSGGISGAACTGGATWVRRMPSHTASTRALRVDPGGRAARGGTGFPTAAGSWSRPSLRRRRVQ